MSKPIRIEIIDADSDHIIIRADEPCRIELSLAKPDWSDGAIILHAYRGTETDLDQEPDAVYDGTMVTPLYEKCAECHLFVEPNDVAPVPGMELAEYVHLHRGDEEDERLDETHEAKPSGERHSLDHWKVHGPHAMRARFTR